MKEHPILFSADMVRAILDGRKTQTRRIVKPQPHDDPNPVRMMTGERRSIRVGRSEHVLSDDRMFLDGNADELNTLLATCPYGHPGDRLWVKETHRRVGWLVAYRADGGCGAWMDDGDGGRIWVKHGWINGLSNRDGEYWGEGAYGDSWKPPIHMPRWASRIDLEITDVRVQRVQDISEEDAISEGCEEDRYRSGHEPGTIETAVIAYQRLWDRINGKTFPWANNPWAWAVTFKRINQC